MSLGDFNLSSPQFATRIVNPTVENAVQGRASNFCKHLIRMVNDFNESLDDKHEVGAKLVSFGQTIVFYLEFIGYQDPFLIILKGKTDNGDPVELIQHISQISILLMKLERQHPELPKKPIGFHSI